MGGSFDQSVFVNCPFDEEYEPILQAILFSVVYLDFQPRVASERANSAESRLDKIRDLIRDCKYSIHDLSRCQSKEAGEHARLNMPFELGIDFGCKQFFGNGRDSKKILVLEEERYRYQIVLSDLSGCDIEEHDGNFETAVQKVVFWLQHEAGLAMVGPRKVLDAYVDGDLRKR